MRGCAAGFTKDAIAVEVPGKTEQRDRLVGVLGVRGIELHAAAGVANLIRPTGIRYGRIRPVALEACQADVAGGQIADSARRHNQPVGLDKDGPSIVVGARSQVVEDHAVAEIAKTGIEGAVRVQADEQLVARANSSSANSADDQPAVSLIAEREGLFVRTEVKAELAAAVERPIRRAVRIVAQHG